MLINPNMPISSFIQGYTGITNEMVQDAPAIQVALPVFLQFAGDFPIIGHNVNFDINFIYENCMRTAQNPFCNNFLDTMRLSRKLFPQYRHHRLIDLVTRFGIGRTVEHRALGDAYQAHACYQYMLRYMRQNEISMCSLLTQKQKLRLQKAAEQQTLVVE